MSGIMTVTVEEARGFVAVPADLFRLAVVVGCSSTGSGLSPFFMSTTAARANRGYGDAVDTLCQIIEQRQATGGSVKFPAAMYTTPQDVAGSYGSIDITEVLGTALPAVSSSVPLGTYNAFAKIVDGGTIGVAGITYQTRLGFGPWSNITALGTGHAINISNSGVGFIVGPPAAQVTALIAAVVEARTNTLAHLADVTAHDAADTSAAQVALAAASAPTTEAQAISVLNLCRAALASHQTNITVHNGPDPVNVVSHAAATDAQSAIELYVEYRADFNAHIGIALAADPVGLKAATATTVTPQTVIATGMIAGGVTALNLYPRRLIFTTAGSTASDAPPTASVTGFDLVVAAQSETATIAQTATTSTSAKAWRGTGLSVAYAAADGTGATVAIGYGQGVHNSADVTNTLAATTPTAGTLAANDTWSVRTYGPVPGAADIYDGTTTPTSGAFAELARASANFALVVLDFPIDASLVGTITSGINACFAVGKRVTVLVRTRIPDFEAGETEAAWLTDVAGDFRNSYDSRICPRATYGMVTDATTARVYYRSTLQQFAADVVRVGLSTWPCAPADRAEGNVSLSDSAGATVGHDEGERGGATGLSNDTIGNRFSCEQRLGDAQRIEDVFNTVPWVLYAPDELVPHLMARRVLNEMAREAFSAAVTGLGQKLFFDPAVPSVVGSQNTLRDPSRRALHGAIFQRLKARFGKDIQNSNDSNMETGLVQVDPVVTVASGSLLGVRVTIAPLLFGYLLSETIIIAPKNA